MNSLDYRLKEFLPAAGRHSVLMDASAGLALGTPPGLIDFENALRPVLHDLDGVVCSPGQLRRLGNRTRSEAALLVRMDWTNALRGPAFPLPPKEVTRVSILGAEDALELGASAMVVSLLLGYTGILEAACMKEIVKLSLRGKDLGLPLLVEVCPTGPGILLPGKAVELGASFALEAGADVIAIPHTETDSLRTIATMLSVPWLFKPVSARTCIAELEATLEMGAAGTWLDHTWLEPSMPLAEISCRRAG